MVHDTQFTAHIGPSDYVDIGPNLPGVVSIYFAGPKGNVTIYANDQQAIAIRNKLLAIFPLPASVPVADPLDLISDGQAKADLALQTV